ncbi:MAG: methyl-accepting chemotaxis protein [Actinobacteria bacterium]|nr:methyl-accepting chemotaxis protein [Actinomycetota bacterium]
MTTLEFTTEEASSAPPASSPPMQRTASTGGPSFQTAPDAGPARVRRPGGVALAAPAWVLGRLSLAWKFALITAVLAAPLGFVVQRYVEVQQTNEAFSSRERVGIELVEPLFALETVLVDVRTTVSSGGTIATDEVAAAVQGVQDVADAGVAAELGVTEAWDDLAASITATTGAPVASAAEAFDAWSEQIAATTVLIAGVADASNLTLDPDLDTFYLMDIATTKAPALMAAAGARLALASLPPTEEQATQSAIQQVRIDDAAAAIDAGLSKTVGVTADAAIADEMEAVRLATVEAVASATDAPGLQAFVDDAAVLGAAASDALDRLIATRVEGFAEQRRVTLWFSGIAIVVALWLFAALFVTTRAGIAEMRRVLRRAATGDLNERVSISTRDEIAALGAQLNATLDEQLRLERETAVQAERDRQKDAELRAAEQHQLEAQQRELARAEELKRKVDEMLLSLAAAANGDLTVPVTVSGDDAIGRMGVALAKVLADLRSNVGRIAGSSGALAAAAEELQVVAGNMDDNVAETAHQLELSSASSSDVARNVETVSAGIEELSSAIKEIARSSSDAVQIANGGVSAARSSQERVVQLGDRSNEIGAIVKVINGIAEQTNLLALNATIEAARAGEAGKGFAVVANEVKELASGTARATEDITNKIEAIQADIAISIESITAIVKVIDEIAEYQHAIAAAVEEQAATTSQIAHSAQVASGAAQDITERMDRVSASAQGAASGAADSRAAAVELSRMAADLQQVVGAFVY